MMCAGGCAGTANDYWRDLAYNLARFVAITALGVFLGLVFYNVRHGHASDDFLR